MMAKRFPFFFLSCLMLLAGHSPLQAAPVSLDPLFAPEMPGAPVAQFEQLAGKPVKVEGSERVYSVNGCSIVLTGAETVESLTLEVNDQCSFDLNPFLQGTGPLQANTLTFGSFDKATGGTSLYYADCIYMCGNSFDPTVSSIYKGPRALGFLDIQVKKMLVDDASIAAAEEWSTAMLQNEGQEWVIDGKFNCEQKYTQAAQNAFQSVGISSITIGYDLDKDFCNAPSMDFGHPLSKPDPQKRSMEPSAGAVQETTGQNRVEQNANGESAGHPSEAAENQNSQRQNTQLFLTPSIPDPSDMREVQ